MVGEEAEHSSEVFAREEGAGLLLLSGWPGLVALQRVLDVPLQGPGFVLVGLR